MNALATFKMACRAEASVGARCRHMVDGPGLCSQHAEAKLASPPTTVLVKTRVNKRWMACLEEAGVRWQRRDDEAIKQRHVDEAEKLGRKPDAFRQTPDSGVPVFGKEGASSVSVDRLLDELAAGGYRLTDVHMYQRPQDQPNMANLTLQFQHRAEAEKVIDLPAPVRDLVGSTWEFAHVWANPTKPDGSTPHTVNLSHRFPDVEPKFRLVFDGGYWNLTPV